MSAGVKMGRGVFSWRRVAAEGYPAGLAGTEVYPMPADFHAFGANRGLIGQLNVGQFGDMGAGHGDVVFGRMALYNHQTKVQCRLLSIRLVLNGLL